MAETSTLDNLRKLILVKTGLTVISPSDCKAISLSIQKELNRTISETTIKRLFGFATITTNFSKFTINTLTEFASEENGNKIAGYSPFSNTIQKIAANAKQRTNVTLQNIRTRCSVPYELTIPRKFAKHDFHYFYESEYSFTAFIAQPGYGKTILLSHLVQDLVEKNEPRYLNDVVCFFEAKSIFDPNNSISLAESIKTAIGLSVDTDLVSYFEAQYQQSNGKLILILDGFAELVLNRQSKIKIFERIIDLISAIGESNAIKIILGMRPTIWNRFFERLRHAYFLKRKWFPGSYYYLDYNSNVPPLSEKELELVIEKMNPGSFKQVSADLKSQLKFPFHIQWYYRLKEKYPTFNAYTNTTFYEIIDLFIKEKIYESNYVTEKIFFCTQIIKRTDFSKKGDRVAKNDLMQTISVYKNAYMELLVDGILVEEKQFNNNFAVEYIRFVHPHTFEYFLFIEMLDRFHQNMDEKFFLYIQDEYFGNQVRFQLLQWSIRQLIINGDYKNIANLFTIDLTNYEKNYLIYFIAESLNYRCIDYPETRNQIKEQNLHRSLIHELVHFDFIDSCYKDAIECLLGTVDTPENAKFYHSLLAIIDCLSFNQEKIAERLKKLEALNFVQNHVLINPYDIVVLIYSKLKGIPVAANNQTLKIVDSLKRNQTSLNVNANEFPQLESFIEYLLIILLNAFYGSQKDFITLIHMILGSYPKLIKRKNTFSIYLLNLLALSSARINPSKKTDQMERVITEIYHRKKKPTLYSQSLLLVLKAQQRKNKKDYQKAIELTKEALIIFKRNDLVMYELLMYNLLISIYSETRQPEEVNRYTYKKLTLLEDKNIPFLSLEYIDFE